MAASTPPFSQSPFDFAPHATQDTELLRQLNFVPGLKEILMVRQVHALEHATVWVLSGAMPPTRSKTPLSFFASSTEVNQLSGMSTSEGFYLYGKLETSTLRRAVQQALQRMTQGEWNLAVHPRCGTNLSVGMLMTAGFALGAHLIMPRDPISQLVGLGAATFTTMQLAPEIGGWVQKHVTTSIPFNLAVSEIRSIGEHQGHPAHFVRVQWIER